MNRTFEGRRKHRIATLATPIAIGKPLAMNPWIIAGTPTANFQPARPRHLSPTETDKSQELAQRRAESEPALQRLTRRDRLP